MRLSAGWVRQWILLWVFGTSVAGSCPDEGDLIAVRSEERTFTSPNYPNSYPDNTECVWRITAEQEDDVVQLVTKDMHIEQQLGEQGCAYDYVQVFDGYGSENSKLARWCGMRKRTVVSSGRSVTVRFQTDKSYTARGFRIGYKSGSPDSFVAAGKPRLGLSTMAMVGYMVLVLSLLTVGIISLRLVLSRSKWCQHVSSHRRSLFHRQPNRDRTSQVQRSDCAPEVSVIAVAPPPYEETAFDNAPPPYTELPLNVTVAPVGQGPAEDMVNNGCVSEEIPTDLPPSYSCAMLQNLESSSSEGCDTNASLNTVSADTANPR